MALWVANRKVYGAHKLWKAAVRAGHDIGRDQVARLMRELGIRGVSRRRKVFTTRPDPDGLRAPDLVNRDFTADRPDALWVTDLTYVPTRSGMAYVCFIVDAFSRRIVGWGVAANMRTEIVLDALEMARRSRGGRRLVGLVAHSDAGSQFTSVRFTERLDEIGARPSIGTVADSFDNALAETTNGLYKAECVYGPDANGWDDVDELELATLSWVHWFNHQRLHGHCNDTPPAEFEAAFYAAQHADPAGVGIQYSPSLHQTQGGSTRISGWSGNAPTSQPEIC
jgi:putative transposase